MYRGRLKSTINLDEAPGQADPPERPFWSDDVGTARPSDARRARPSAAGCRWPWSWCCRSRSSRSGWNRQISFETLVRHNEAIHAFILGHRIAAVAIYIAVYVVTIALSLPGGLVLTLTGGFLFGGLVGGAAAVVGATIGATIIFLIAKSAFGEHLARRAGPLAEKLAAGVPRRRVPLSAVPAAGAGVSVLPGQSRAGAGRRAACRPSSPRPASGSSRRPSPSPSSARASTA